MKRGLHSLEEYANTIGIVDFYVCIYNNLGGKVYGANMGPNWGRQDPGASVTNAKSLLTKSF